MRRIPFFLGAIVMTVTLAGTALAASSYTLFGDALVVTGGNPGNAARIRSDAAIAPQFGGVDFTVPSGLTFAGLTMLSADYNVTDDNCGGGSPRLQINVNTGSGIKNIFAYLGPPPGYNTCTPNVWSNDGNLVGGIRTLDTSQLPGGAFYDTYAHAVSAYGSYPVVGIQVVVDGSWNSVATGGDGEQTVLIDNVRINSDLITFENAASCKDNGWASMTRADGSPFKNQGDCIQYVNTGR